MIDSRNINELHPILQVLTNRFIAIANSRGIRCGVSSTFRSNKMQDYYYSVTKTTTVKGGYSYHNHRLAVDIVPLNNNGVIYWPEPKVFDWTLLGQIGEELGLEWGGRWTSFVDRPHYQMTFGLTCANILAGKPIPQTIVRGCPDARLVKLVQTLVGVGADGLFGPATEAAVKKHNPSGVVDAATLKKLLDNKYDPKPAEPEKPRMMKEFADVPENHWAAADLKFLYDLGIISGYQENGKTVLGLGKPIEIERTAALIARAIRKLS